MSTNLIWLLFKPSHLLIYGLLLGLTLWRRPIGKRLLVGFSVVLIAVGISPVSAWLIVPLETRFDPPDALARVDGIIVLAGPERPDLSVAHGTPQFEHSTDRLTTFLLLATRYPSARLVHSGRGAVGAEFDQSRPARELILGTGIPEERVLFEDSSRNTCEGARMTRALVVPGKEERWLLVTSAYHMPRAVACFRATNWDVIAFPTDYKRGSDNFRVASVTTNLLHLDWAAHEWVGLIYYRMRGYTSELFPNP